MSRASIAVDLGMLYFDQHDLEERPASSLSAMKSFPAKREMKTRPTSSVSCGSLGVDVRKISVIPDELASSPMKSANFFQILRLCFYHRWCWPYARRFDHGRNRGGIWPAHPAAPELEATLRQFYSQELIDGNLRMADVPEGARIVGGKGMWFPVVAVENVYIFPGVPEILRRKFERIKEMFREAPFHLVKFSFEPMKARSPHICTASWRNFRI